MWVWLRVTKGEFGGLSLSGGVVEREVVRELVCVCEGRTLGGSRVCREDRVPAQRERVRV